MESRSYERSLRAAFIDAFRSTNARFLEVADRAGLNDGSTALCLALRGGRMTVANVGDCRLLLVGQSWVEQVSRDHKPGVKEEEARVIALGGAVTTSSGIPRVNGILAVSRAFGNRALRGVVRPDPEIFERELTADDRFLVLGSDGVWDVIRNKDVLKACWGERGRSCQHIADALVRQALLLGSQDNISCVVINVAKYFLATSALRIDGAEGRIPYNPRMQALRDGVQLSAIPLSASLRPMTVGNTLLIVRPKSGVRIPMRSRDCGVEAKEKSEKTVDMMNKTRTTRLPKIVDR